jgi:GT2 family glycosyltransferase
MSVFVHIVTFNDSAVIAACLQSVLQEAQQLDMEISVTDNASTDGTFDVLQDFVAANSITAQRNIHNLGFCGGHNQGVRSFLQSSKEFLLLLNPDCALLPGSTAKLVQVAREHMQADAYVGAFCGKLLVADEGLEIVEPRSIDSAGMFFTNELRHFDRGSKELDRGQFDKSCEVAGISGAYILMTRAFVEDLLLADAEHEPAVDRVYPQLQESRAHRALLFDEAFFAYREDAELSLRARRLGWRFWYFPIEVGAHVRRVLPQNRSELPAMINALSVRNRFLLQLLHFYPSSDWRTFWSGFVVRNLLVLVGVFLRERSSLVAFWDLGLLARRSWERRKLVESRAIGCLTEFRWSIDD